MVVPLVNAVVAVAVVVVVTIVVMVQFVILQTVPSQRCRTGQHRKEMLARPQGWRGTRRSSRSSTRRCTTGHSKVVGVSGWMAMGLIMGGGHWEKGVVAPMHALSY